MASPLIFKIYREKEFVASAKYAEDAAAIASMTAGTVIKWSGRIVFREGADEVKAEDSYDAAAALIYRRVSEQKAALRKRFEADMAIQAARLAAAKTGA